MEAKYGLMSIRGVPSMQSILRTLSVVASMAINSTAASAMGLGRTGERSAKVPRGWSKYAGTCWIRSRRI